MTMKNIHKIILGLVIIFLVILAGAATVRSTGEFRFRLTAPEMLGRVTKSSHFTGVPGIASMMGDVAIIIDLRDHQAYDASHIPDAVNIPFDMILDKSFRNIFLEGKKKVLYCDDGKYSDAAWMILTQFGYENLSVLGGGYKAWNSFTTSRESYNEETAKDEIMRFRVSGSGAE
jgi:rhodanese-related sulfurtransferase